MSPKPSYPAPQGWLATPWTPLSCGMAVCWQVNSILANIGRRNSILIFESVPLLMKNINMSIVYLLYKVLIIPKIKVVLYNYIYNCSCTKVPSKADQNNGLMALIRAQLGIARTEWGQREFRTSGWRSVADDMFPL